MKKTLVFYKSKTGFTERYARWIAEEVQADLKPISDVNQELLDDYDILVYGGPIFAGRITGLGKVQGWVEKLRKKTWVVFATGATPSEKAFVASIERVNFTEDTPKPARFYYFLSGMNFEKMSWFNRLLIRIFSGLSQRKRTGEKPKQSPSKKLTSVDLCDRSYIEPLVKYVRLKQ